MLKGASGLRGDLGLQRRDRRMSAQLEDCENMRPVALSISDSASKLHGLSTSGFSQMACASDRSANRICEVMKVIWRAHRNIVNALVTVEAPQLVDVTINALKLGEKRILGKIVVNYPDRIGRAQCSNQVAARSFDGQHMTGFNVTRCADQSKI